MKNWFKSNWPIVVVILIASIIVTPKLDKPYFWQDEAESALLARSILNEGIPTAWDGTNLVAQISGNASNVNYTWSITPWLPFYVIAGSFKVLGESHFAGRIPFVIFGIFGLLSVYLLAYHFTKNKYVSILSSLFLLLNFQFIFYSRQCKYYSILFLIPPLLYLVYDQINKNLRQFALFVLFVVILFYTNYVSLYTSLIGLIIYTFIIKRDKDKIRSFVLAGIISLCVTIPFFFISEFGMFSSLVGGFPSIHLYLEKLARHILYFNNMVFGLLAFIPLIVFYKMKLFEKEELKFIKFILCIVFSAWLALPLLNQDVFRYNIHLIPLFGILLSLIVVAGFRRSKVLGVIFVALFMFTNLFSYFPKAVINIGLKATGARYEGATSFVASTFKVDESKARKHFRKLDRNLERLTYGQMVARYILKSEYMAYYNELTKDYPDALESTVNLLREKAKPNEKVYMNFDKLSLAFYLPELQYVYAVSDDKLINKKIPPLPKRIKSIDEVDWYVYRQEKLNLGPFINHADFIIKMESKGKSLVPFKLGVSSLYWDINWPEEYQAYLNKMLWKDEDGFDEVVVYNVR